MENKFFGGVFPRSGERPETSAAWYFFSNNLDRLSGRPTREKLGKNSQATLQKFAPGELWQQSCFLFDQSLEENPGNSRKW